MPDRARLSPAVADVRRAVREVLDELEPGSLVLVALSGGADSLALAAGVAFEAPRAALRAGAVIVDHGLQPGSAEVAQRVGEHARALGLDPVLVRRVAVSGPGGPEAAARAARYETLDATAAAAGASAVLLGHTLDDQAESVLLGLARGSGATSLAGMAGASGRYRRPLLGIRRETTRKACRDAGLEPWDDPHNTDPVFTRVRVRTSLLPMLEDELGPGVAEALARTADQLREDASALDAFADATAVDAVTVDAEGAWLDVELLTVVPAAIRQRLIRRVAAREFGAALSRAHTLAVARLVTDWSGQGPIDLPGLVAQRVGGRVRVSRATLGSAG